MHGIRSNAKDGGSDHILLLVPATTTNHYSKKVSIILDPTMDVFDCRKAIVGIVHESTKNANASKMLFDKSI